MTLSPPAILPSPTSRPGLRPGSGARAGQGAEQGAGSGLVGTHWGLYRHRGDISTLADFEGDGDPARFGLGLAGDRLAPCRVLRPAVRRSYLEHGPVARRGRRGSEPFVEVSWDEALDLVAHEIRRVRDTYGPGALYSGSYGWSSAGRFHHAQSQLKRFFNMAGGSVRSVQTYSYAAGEVLLPHVIGTQEGLIAGHTPWADLIGQAELIVMFGGTPLRNAQVSAGGIAAHTARDGLLACKAAGADFVTVSPMRADAADALGAQWMALRPNTDTALLLALAFVLIREGLHDQAFLDRFTTGFETFRAYVVGESDGIPKDPDWAAAITGLGSSDIVALARRMAGRRTFLMMAWSLQRADHGEQPYWAAIALASLLGGIGRPGEGFGFGYAAIDGVGVPHPAVSWPSLPQGRNPVDDYIPVARIADMLLHPGETYDHDGAARRYPDIRLVYWAGGNPFHHHQDLNRLVEAWQRPETVIAHEHWWNAHARHADIVLPAATFFERDDLVASGRDRFLAYSSRAAEPPGAVRTDYEILAGVADRLGVADAYTEGRDAEGWLRHLYDQAWANAAARGFDLPPFEEFRAQGLIDLPPKPGPRPLLGAFRADPEGHPLRTPSGRIELASARIASFGYGDCPGHPAWRAPAEWLGAPLAARYPFHLLSCQPADKLHSQWDHAAPSRRTKAGGRQPILMHPTDMAERGIAAGDVVEVSSPRGRCLAVAEPCGDLLPKVVQLATGAWFDPQDPAAPGSLEVNGNPNVLTADHGTSRLGQGPSPNSCLVDIRRFEGPVPPVRAYRPPDLVPDPRPDQGSSALSARSPSSRPPHP